MTKKRKLELNIKSKSAPVEIIVEDVLSHPFCVHGPTLLFSSAKEQYFACSSSRNKKDCAVHIEKEDWAKDGVKKRNEKYYDMIPTLDKTSAWLNFSEVKSNHASNRAYCITCDELYVLSKSKKHTKDHNVITPLTDEQLASPSSWLPTLENDSVEAQFLFTMKPVSTILGILRNNNVKNILCIGTPTIHEAALAGTEFNSILLDLDKRHHIFHSNNKFIWYNMFNNYLFNGNKDDKILKKFLKNSRDTGISIVMDPPFGGRVEPLVHTIKELSQLYKSVCEIEDDIILPVIWAFPYFAEPYITNMVPEIKMHDYQVEYQNHKKFHSKGRKFGSPVRFFTNLPFNTIDLSNDSKYKMCEKCKYWVAATNNHCNKCGQCTSKNGMRYKHCNTCKRCVKPTFFHCKSCKRCCQEKGHDCNVIVESQSCYVCHERGHKQSKCPKQDNTPEGSKKKRRINA